jgi:hypothetical protein
LMGRKLCAAARKQCYNRRWPGSPGDHRRSTEGEQAP